MKLIIELDVDLSDFSEQDAELFIREAEEATGINVEVGRPISEEESEVFRQFSLGTEYFKARLERGTPPQKLASESAPKAMGWDRDWNDDDADLQSEVERLREALRGLMTAIRTQTELSPAYDAARAALAPSLPTKCHKCGESLPHLYDENCTDYRKEGL